MLELEVDVTVTLTLWRSGSHTIVVSLATLAFDTLENKEFVVLLLAFNAELQGLLLKSNLISKQSRPGF